jgi:hypothetical protein
MKILFLLPALFLIGCATPPPSKPVQPNPIKVCAQALVVLNVAAECTALTPNICIFTMGDLLVAREAAADKQVYCPRLEPGQDGANN